jgi:hypothetical protein
MRRGEDGLTLVELLIATTMSVVLVGATASMLISAVQQQPQLSRKAQNVTTARWQLERVTREIRDGVAISPSVRSATEVSFLARVRRTSCGGVVPTNPATPAIKCQVTYRCTASSCTRTEASEGQYTNPAATAIALSGLDDAEVFCYVPSTESDPTVCGPAATESPTYVGVNLHVPDPDGRGELTISDGASLRSATF